MRLNWKIAVIVGGGQQRGETRYVPPLRRGGRNRPRTEIGSPNSSRTRRRTSFPIAGGVPNRRSEPATLAKLITPVSPLSCRKRLL